MEIIFTSKGEKGISTEEIIKLFENSEDLGEIKHAVENAEKRISVTWASVEMKDKAGELIPIEDIIKQQDILLERNGPITDEHTNRVVGQTVAYKVMEHPKTKSLGVLHLDKYFDHNSLDDQIWKEIQSKQRTGASVGGFNTSAHIGRDKVTGEKAKILEGFNQFETATVFDPCNPMALMESFSVIAKSMITKPAELDRCVQHLMDDPDFKPRDPNQTKEQAAYAVCQAQMQKKLEVEKFWEGVNKRENYINKPDIISNISKKGDTMNTKKSISEIENAIKKLQKELKILKQEEDEEEEKPEEKNKQEEETEEKPEETEEEKNKQEEDEEELKKEEVKIEGEEPAKDQPESPEDKDVGDKDVFKELKQVKKELDKLKGEFITKSKTPRPQPKNYISKSQKAGELAMDLAMGKKRMPWNEVHKMVNEIDMEVV